MIQLFNDLSNQCSKLATRKYSTSFSSAISLLHKDLRPHIHNIYGFVRFADEIVDTFHDHNKQELLAEFKVETFLALERRISLNPILNSFQATVNKYSIGHDLINAFFSSMESDLEQQQYNTQSYNEYIYGSAEVVGLMCLEVFCEGNKKNVSDLKPYAQALGAAFQKINFLRDLSADFRQLNRVYFPGVDFNNFTIDKKTQIEQEIAADFQLAFKGIRSLPQKSRLGVYVAYRYYLSLFRKIKNVKPAVIMEERVRIPAFAKAFIVLNAGVRSRFNIL